MRDLARHVGLQVGRSFKFQAEAYPGYRHARTLGNIEGGGGWKGEERGARTFCFKVKGTGQGPGQGQEGREGKKKRKRDDSEEEDGDG